MSQTQLAKNRQLGIIMLASAFVLGLGLFALSTLAKNERMNTKTLVVKTTETEIVKVKEEIQAQTTEKNDEIKATDEELNNQIIEMLDKDIEELEIGNEDLSNLE